MGSVLTVTAKGQVTLRKPLLRHLGVAPGQRIEVDMLPDGRVQLRAANLSGSIDDFIGSVRHRAAKPLSIEDMGAITAQGWAGRR